MNTDLNVTFMNSVLDEHHQNTTTRNITDIKRFIQAIINSKDYLRKKPTYSLINAANNLEALSSREFCVWLGKFKCAHEEEDGSIVEYGLTFDHIVFLIDNGYTVNDFGSDDTAKLKVIRQIDIVLTREVIFDAIYTSKNLSEASYRLGLYPEALNKRLAELIFKKSEKKISYKSLIEYIQDLKKEDFKREEILNKFIEEIEEQKENKNGSFDKLKFIDFIQAVKTNMDPNRKPHSRKYNDNNKSKDEMINKVAKTLKISKTTLKMRLPEIKNKYHKTLQISHVILLLQEKKQEQEQIKKLCTEFDFVNENETFKERSNRQLKNNEVPQHQDNSIVELANQNSIEMDIKIKIPTTNDHSYVPSHLRFFPTLNIESSMDIDHNETSLEEPYKKICNKIT